MTAAAIASASWNVDTFVRETYQSQYRPAQYSLIAYIAAHLGQDGSVPLSIHDMAVGTHQRRDAIRENLKAIATAGEVVVQYVNGLVARYSIPRIAAILRGRDRAEKPTGIDNSVEQHRAGKPTGHPGRSEKPLGSPNKERARAGASGSDTSYRSIQETSSVPDPKRSDNSEPDRNDFNLAETPPPKRKNRVEMPTDYDAAELAAIDRAVDQFIAEKNPLVGTFPLESKPPDMAMQILKWAHSWGKTGFVAASVLGHTYNICERTATARPRGDNWFGWFRATINNGLREIVTREKAAARNTQAAAPEPRGIDNTARNLPFSGPPPGAAGASTTQSDSDRERTYDPAFTEALLAQIRNAKAGFRHPQRRAG